MKVLLLGASGYLGSSLFYRLREEYDAVIGTSFQTKDNELYTININHHSEVNEMMLNIQPDIVIWSLMSGHEEDRLTQTGLKNLLEMLPQSSKFIYISSDSVFAEGKGNYREEDPTQYLSENNPLHIYANGKLDAEKMVQQHPNHIIIRIGPIYGKNSKQKWDNRIEYLIENLSKGHRIRRANNLYKTFVHIDDVVDGIVKMIDKQSIGTIHLGPLQKESYYTFNRKLAKKLGLDDSLIESDKLEEYEANQRGIPLDTSLNTEKCNQLLSTTFRCV